MMEENGGKRTGVRLHIRNCVVCGKAFECGARSEREKCWCHDYPAVLPVAAGQGCMCRECLADAIAERME